MSSIKSLNVPLLLRERLAARGFSSIVEERVQLASGKSFCKLIAKLA
jgi:hypothetical protein